MSTRWNVSEIKGGVQKALGSPNAKGYKQRTNEKARSRTPPSANDNEHTAASLLQSALLSANRFEMRIPAQRSETHFERGHQKSEDQEATAFGNKLSQDDDVTDGKGKFRHQIVWKNVFLMLVLHILSILTLTLLHKMKIMTLLWVLACFVISELGVTAGVHRLWAHRTYKASSSLRVLLAIWNSMAFQMSILYWARDHRVHHKFSETNADPHNAKRGFFFSHIGWLLIRKHPEVMKKGKNIDLSDLYADPVVMFQHKFYVPLMFLFCFILPTVVPLIWGESLIRSYLACLLRYCLSLNCTWLVNSAAHMWGSRPYDKSINPANNLFVTLFAQGEGFHNYHHVFPWDYSTSEFGIRYNLTTAFIDLMAFLGLARDRRTVSPEMIAARKKRTGVDG